MKPSRRNFLKVWASLAWISSFAGSGFILGLFRGKYRSGCTDGKRLCKGRKKRLSVRRRFPMADDGFVLNKRSKILHWPKFFKHRYSISAKHLLRVNGSTLNAVIDKVRQAYGKPQKIPEWMAGTTESKIALPARGLRSTLTEKDYPSFHALLSSASPPVGNVLARALCSTTYDGLHSKSVGAKTYQTSPATCRFLDEKTPIIAEHFALASIRIEGKGAGILFNGDSIDTAVAIVDGALPVTVPQTQQKQAGALSDLETKFLRLIKPKGLQTRKHLRNYFLYAKLVSIRNEQSCDSAYQLIDRRLRAPYLELRQVEPEKWKWLDTEASFKRWHQKMVSEYSRRRLLNRIYCAQYLLTGGSASSSRLRKKRLRDLDSLQFP